MMTLAMKLSSRKKTVIVLPAGMPRLATGGAAPQVPGQAARSHRARTAEPSCPSTSKPVWRRPHPETIEITEVSIGGRNRKSRGPARSRGATVADGGALGKKVVVGVVAQFQDFEFCASSSSRITSSMVQRREVTPAAWAGVLPLRVRCGRQKL